MEPSGTFPYYEDFYGQRNQEEFNEGSIHRCESDSDETGIQQPSSKPTPNRSVQSVSTRETKGRWSGQKSFGKIKKAPGEVWLSRSKHFTSLLNLCSLNMT